MVQQVVRHLDMPLQNARHQRGAHDFRVLVVGVHTRLNVVTHQGQVARVCGVVHVFPVTSGHGLS